MKKTPIFVWAIALLEEIEHSSEKKAWCQSYSVYSSNPGQETLRRELHSFMDRAYEEGLIIANYGEVIQRWGLEEQHVAAADAEWLAAQPYICVLASIAWHFRRDHFSEGSLISDSIASGTLLRLFRRLRLLCHTVAPATTLENLYCCECSNIPETPGVYWVLAPEGLPIHFAMRTYNPSASLYSAEVLVKKYGDCTDKETLYIGKADGRRGLHQRLKQYMNYGWKNATNHRGGRAIWQIDGAGLLLLAYEECEDAREREKQLLAAYKKKNDTYPLANWRG